MTLDGVTEICTVTLLCYNDAKALLTDYYSLCIVAWFKPEKVPHSVMSNFFWHKYIITLAVATGIFLNGAHFFLLYVKYGIKQVTPHACLHVTLQTPRLVTVAMASDSGALFKNTIACT